MSVASGEFPPLAGTLAERTEAHEPSSFRTSRTRTRDRMWTRRSDDSDGGGSMPSSACVF